MIRKLPFLAAIALFATPALADGDATAGKTVFKRCAACHTVEDQNRVGPSLIGIVGRAIASREGFRYSNAMKAFAADRELWTEELLAEYVAAPRLVVPGTSMAFAGLETAQDIADLIAYLKDPAAAE